MTNIHPLFVHFPIALLFIYSIIKIIPVQKWLPHIAWRDIEKLLLVCGILGAFAALATGDTAERVFQPDRALVNAHSTFAALATWIYVTLLIGSIISAARLHTFFAKIPNAIQVFLIKLEMLLTNKTFSAILAFLGLVAISITGLLGGVMVYGADADPAARVVLKILDIQI
jgi:uncharacterized membrane protein